jgi:hypothetical protein
MNDSATPEEGIFLRFANHKKILWALGVPRKGGSVITNEDCVRVCVCACVSSITEKLLATVY